MPPPNGSQKKDVMQIASGLYRVGSEMVNSYLITGDSRRAPAGIARPS
jgi:hypothetical protein